VSVNIRRKGAKDAKKSDFRLKNLCVLCAFAAGVITFEALNNGYG
jgi:hypothetical protein